jgi:gas vesicle protein
VQEQVAQVVAAEQTRQGSQQQQGLQHGSGTEPSDEQERNADDDEDADDAGEDASGLLSRLGQTVLGALPEALEAEGEDTLDGLVIAALDVVFSDTVRDTIQREREMVVDLLLEGLLTTIPDRKTRRDVKRETQETLHRLVRESIDSIFSGRVREDLHRNLREAIQALLDGNIGQGLKEIGEAIEVVLRELIDVFQDHWMQVLQVLLKVAFKAAQQTVMTAIADGPGGGLEKARDTLEDRGDDLREELSEAVDTLRENVKEAQEELKERIKEGLETAVSGGKDKQLGRRPATRPPSGRPPSGRPPTGRPPNGRPPSAQRS